MGQYSEYINQLIIETQELKPKQNYLKTMITNGDLEAVQDLLKKFKTEAGVRVLLNAKDSNGSTPIFTACWYRRMNMLQLLVANGAEVNTVNIRGNSPIHMAIEQNQLEIIKYLLQHNATANLDMVRKIRENTKKEISYD